jgi:hypothetical protein
MDVRHRSGGIDNGPMTLEVYRMPNLDGTGPIGQGRTTGRGLGNCGKGNGLLAGGRGRGRCLTRIMAQSASVSKEERAKILNERLKELEAERKEIMEKLKNPE